MFGPCAATNCVDLIDVEGFPRSLNCDLLIECRLIKFSIERIRFTILAMSPYGGVFNFPLEYKQIAKLVDYVHVVLFYQYSYKNYDNIVI